MTDRRAALAGAVILVFIALVYWPVREGGFVWDDEIDFLKYDWLTRGDAWKHYIFQDFHGWKNYFRPLVVGLFTIQLRLFDISPGPMHLVSLAVHLANTLMVGTLAQRFAFGVGHTPSRIRLLPMVAMAIYGLHPAHIEPIAWIASQADLFATFFMLLGLNLNAYTEGRVRSAAVGICFFLAACSKESAISFPFLLVITDWILQPVGPRPDSRAPRLQEFLRENASKYATVLIAGLIYLALRHWALGLLNLPAEADGPSLFGRINTACFLILRYALVLLAPTVGMGPLHPFDPSNFEQADWRSLATITLVIGVLAASAWKAFSRRSIVSCTLLAFALALLPVTRLIPSSYENELYATRYLMMALAIVCAMLPALLARIPAASIHAKAVRPALIAIAITWVAMSAVTIRSTLPLWANSVSLWQWALSVDPMSARAANALLIAYADRGLTQEARALSSQVAERRIKCFNCMLTMVEINLRERDMAGANAAINEAASAADDPAANDHMRSRFNELTAIIRQMERQGQK